MIGAIAFAMVIGVACTLSWLWMNGKLPAFIESERLKCEVSVGKVYHLRFSRWDFSVRVNRTFWVRAAFMVLGPAAILGLSMAYAQLLPLRVAFVLYVLPSYLTMAVLGVIYPEWGKRALVGFSAGVLATVAYDVARMVLVVALGLPDPIPHIGALWIGQAAVDGNQWWIGYLWRFFGNGGGMGIVYAMLPKWWFDLKGGWLYGDAVGMGMFVLLFLSPLSQLHLFALNYIVLVNGILGHWAYGLALGYIFMKTKLIDTFTDHNAKKRPKPTWSKDQV